MMYWIVFALFTCAETFTDVLLSFWFPFYYEMKIIVVLWLLSPATRGSSILYRKFVHPTLKKKEQEIDEAINHAKAQGYRTILQLGARGVDYARYVIMQTAIKGGGGLMNQLRKSYSLSDLTDQHDGPKYRAIGLGSLQEEHDIVDHHGDPQYMRRSYMHPAHRSGSVPSPMEMYFSEVDLDLRKRSREERQAAIGLPLSLEDVSSGYSSADHLFSSSQGNSPTSDHTVEDILLRSSSIGSTHTKSRKPLYGGMSSNKSSEMPGYVTLPRLRRTPRKRITQ
ncbi:receptor expression-enhancing protein 1-like isoform X6 [Thrips palmi]|uniref:Receptor expression-enhancing protein n=1 Tax=Thrips palmi TaxID=161013 RepID=A0A6P8Z3F8_THRPL|nr:receptor expression-enhancing protein 1-like isoform X6 [Thrips palmi]